MSTTLYAECTVVHTCSVFTGAGPAETRFDSVRALAMMMNHDDYNSEEDVKASANSMDSLSQSQQTRTKVLVKLVSDVAAIYTGNDSSFGFIWDSIKTGPFILRAS